MNDRELGIVFCWTMLLGVGGLVVSLATGAGKDFIMWRRKRREREAIRAERAAVKEANMRESGDDSMIFDGTTDSYCRVFSTIFKRFHQITEELAAMELRLTERLGRLEKLMQRSPLLPYLSDNELREELANRDRVRFGKTQAALDEAQRAQTQREAYENYHQMQERSRLYCQNGGGGSP